MCRKCIPFGHGCSLHHLQPLTIYSTSGNTIDSYASAARSARSKTPSSLSGGRLLNDDEIDALNKDEDDNSSSSAAPSTT